MSLHTNTYFTQIPLEAISNLKKKDKNVQILIDIKTKLHGMKSKYSLFTCEVILSL